MRTQPGKVQRAGSAVEWSGGSRRLAGRIRSSPRNFTKILLNPKRFRDYNIVEMKRKRLLPILAIAAATAVCAVEPGDPASEVLRQYGEPTARADLGHKQLWKYPQGTVTIADDAVLESTLPRIDKEAAAAKLAEGEELAAGLRTSVEFLLTPPARQLEVVQQIRARYPGVDVSDLERGARAGLAATTPPAPAPHLPAPAPVADAPNPEVLALQQRLRDLEEATRRDRERAEAEARVRQRVEAQAAERERNRRTFYYVPTYYHYPSVIDYRPALRRPQQPPPQRDAAEPALWRQRAQLPRRRLPGVRKRNPLVAPSARIGSRSATLWLWRCSAATSPRSLPSASPGSREPARTSGCRNAAPPGTRRK